MFKIYKLCANLVDFTDVAVLPRDQRHLWLFYQVEGYTEEIDWVERLRMGYTMDDGKEIFVSHAWKRLFEILTLLVRPPPSYTLIRDLVLRLCHRMMVHIIAGRSQAPEKVTVTDLFYLRALDVRSGNIPYLLSQYLRRFAAGRKAGLLSQEGDAGGVAEEALVEPTGGDEDEEMPQAVPSSPRT
nr:hypothetical protein [Tanacetum cinerariifolium]